MSCGRYQKVPHFKITAPGQTIVHHYHTPTLEEILNLSARTMKTDSMFIYDGEKWVLSDMDSFLKKKVIRPEHLPLTSNYGENRGGS